MSQRRVENYFWVVLLAAACLLFFFRLGTIALLGPDEPRYARVAWEMYERGDLVTPTLLGHTWFEKPVLLYWMIWPFYALLGMNEWAARLPNAILATCGLLLVYDCSKRAFGKRYGLLAGLALGCCGLYLGLARAASFDMQLTFTFTLALALFYRADTATTTRERALSLAGFYAAVGLSMLAKGLVGPVLIGAIVFAYLVCTGQLRKLFCLRPFYGLLIFLAVAALWYAPVILKHGWLFVDEFFIQHHFQRYTSNKYRHPGPLWYFLVVILLGAFPWSLYLIRACTRAFHYLRTHKLASFAALSPQQRLLLLSALWVVVPTVFFSFSGSKLPGYILPVFPALSLIVANELSRDERNRLERWTALWMILIGIGLGVYVVKELEAGWLLGGLPIVLSVLVAGYVWMKGVWGLFCYTPVMVLLIAGTLFPAIEQDASIAPLSRLAARELRTGEQVIFFRYLQYTPLFYTEGRVVTDGRVDAVRVDSAPQIEGYLDRSLLCITKQGMVKELESLYRVEILGRQRDLVLVRIERGESPS